MEGYMCSLLCLLVFALFGYGTCQRTEVNPCRSGIPCDNGQCISKEEWCNKFPNCRDGTDEKYCGKIGWFGGPSHTCTEKHFVCGNGRCIPAVAKCDNFDDCTDFSDEECPPETMKNCLVTLSNHTVASLLVQCEPGYDGGLEQTFHLEVYSSNKFLRGNLTAQDSPTFLVQDLVTGTSSILVLYAANAKGRSNSVTLVTGTVMPAERHTGGEAVTTTESFSTTFRQEEDERSFQSVPSVIGENTDTLGVHEKRIPAPPSLRNGQINNRNPQNHYPYNKPNSHQNSHQNNRPDARTLPYHGNSTTPRNAQRPNHNYPNSRHHTAAAGQPSENNEHSAPPRNTQHQNFNQQNSHLHNRDPNAVSPRNGRESQVHNSQVQRQQPVLIQPRWVQYLPISREPYYTRKDTTLSLPSFYFAKNYEQHGDNYEDNVERAKAWLLGKRDSSYGWGRDTPRALVALSLINNRFTSDIADNDFMKKGLQTHLGIKLLRNKTEPLTNSRLAMYINALLATCQNPQDFLGLNLVEQLYNRRNVLKPLQTAVNPFVYLTLCLSGIAIDRTDISRLKSLTVSIFHDDIAKDRHILATTALACFLQQTPRDRDLTRIVYDAVAGLLNQKLYDGTFGNIYSTAIAAQALMSVNSTSWDPWPTLNYLANSQLNDGSFGDMLSTYYIIPVLSGRSLLHLRNTRCEKTVVSQTFTPDDILNAPGKKKIIFYSLRVGRPETFSISMQLEVPENTNCFDIMRVAEYQDPRFKFDYKIVEGKTEVYTIANVPNDPERGLYWNLYELRNDDKTVDIRRRSTKDVKELIPANYQELLFWYLPTV